ncbi:MAG: hypothetical protein M3Y81_18090 [Chloroflexota bacterium]|nr:hypothetical protein [Chloroflexota bacterium]
MTASTTLTVAGVPTPTNYNPKDHLITIQTKQGPTLYYPAPWRLYELRLRYPHASVEAEIVHLNTDADLVIVKARIFDGADYDMSQHKATALKQGSVKELDKVETKAKARAARDFGIGTEYALDFDSGESGEDDLAIVPSTLAHSTVVESTPPAVASAPATASLALDLQQVKDRALAARIATDKKTWRAFVTSTLKQDVPDEQFTRAQIALLNGTIEQGLRTTAKAS